MEDTELYTMLLGITSPWRVTKVMVNMPAERIDVWVEEAPGTRFSCAVCAQLAPVYDHTEEQVWRHLDTCPWQKVLHGRLPRTTGPGGGGGWGPWDPCRCQTFLHARLPRTKCPVDGVKQIPAPWAGPRAQKRLALA